MIRALRPHAVNLEQGRFSQNGKMTSDPTTVQEIFQKHFRAWSQQQAAEGRPAKLMLFAHGGLVGESQALAQAYATYRWWLENGVYPVFFIWETGPLEIALRESAAWWGGSGGPRENSSPTPPGSGWRAGRAAPSGEA
jgi:hypothetical protein